MFVPARTRTIGERWSDLSTKQKGAFAVAATAIMLLAIAASVEHERMNDHPKITPDPHLRVVDLDYMQMQGDRSPFAYYAVGPLGELNLGSRADGVLAKYRFGSDWVSFSAAGSTYSGLESWQGLVGSSAPTVDGVRARYPQFYPSTGLEIVSGLDGMELILDVRSAPFIGSGNLAYSFFVETSPSIAPALSNRPLWAEGPGPHTLSGGIPLKDGSGRTVFMIAPATAIFEYRAAPGPVVSRVNGIEYTAYFPPHDEGDRELVQLNYEVEFVGNAMKLSVIVPTELLWDPAMKWPLLIDPGITNPISNASYFVDETILMDSDLVVTSTGAAQFSNVTLIMNRTSAPNYNVSVEAGGRMTLLNSRARANDSALKYNFTVNGTFTAQDTVINNTNDGLKLMGESSTLSNVTIQGGTGRALVIEHGNSTLTKVELKAPLGTGLSAQFANLQASYVNATSAGGEGFYLNATSGNVSWSHALNSTMNGVMIVNGSRVNVTNSEFAGSGRNGVLIIGGAPTIEQSSITANNWSGVALFDDHSAYLYGNRIASNNRSGIEARLNSTVDIYVNTIENNLQAGVRAIASDPNIERNLILNNSVGAWMEGAHNPGAKPGATPDTEQTYATLMAASGELGEGHIVPLVVGVSIAHTGASTQSAVPPATKQFTLQVTNTDTPGTPAKSIALSIDDDQPAWASLSQSSLSLSGGQSASVTLTIVVPAGAATGVTYDVKVHANMTSPPTNPKASVWAYVDLQASTTTIVSSITTGNSTTVVLNAVLMGIGGPLAGKTLAFKLDGHWIGEDATDSGGVAILEVTVSQPPLSQVLLVYFNGTQYYAASSGSGYVNITWTATRLEAPDASGRWGDASSLTVRLMTTPGENPAAGRPIHFTLDGTYLGIGYTDRYGYASWVFDDAVEPGTVAWNASFNEDTYTGLSSNTSNFTSLKDITDIAGPSFTIRYGETASHNAVLTDDEGYPLASRSVEFKRGGTSLGSATTDSQGLATFSDTGAASLTEGDYSMTYVFAAESHFNGVTHYLTLTVRKWVSVFNVTDQTEHYSDTVDLKAQLKDEAGDVLQSKSVNVYLGTTLLGSVTTSSTGWAIYSDTANRLPKTYSLSFAFTGDTRNTAINTTVNLTVLREITVLTSVVDARIVLGAVLAITIRLTDDEGNPLSRFVNVTLLGGIYATGTTDGSGYLTVNFDSRGMLPQRYVLWYFFDGDTNYSQSESYTRIVVEYEADAYGNTIKSNGVGVLANNSSSKLVGNLITGSVNNVIVTNGSLLIYNSSVGLSTVSDYRLGTGGSIYSTNTTFNRGKVTFEAGAVLLHVRWFLNVKVLDPLSENPMNAVNVLLRNVTGDTILNKATNAAGWFGEEAVTEYAQDGSGKSMKTQHQLQIAGINVTVVMDVTRNMTLYTGEDSDNDGLPNRLEDASDVYWVEAEAHVLEYTQIVETAKASGGRAVGSLAGDGRFVDPTTYPVSAAGSYSLLLRASAVTTNGTLRAVVRDANGTALMNLTYTPSGEFRWFQSPVFSVAFTQALTINLTDESSNPSAARIEVDEIALARMTFTNGSVAHWSGQVSSPLQPDSDFDNSRDGAELREGTFWYEAEMLAPWNGGQQRSNWNASNSWELGHAAGSLLTLSINQTLTSLPGIYALWVRARGNGTAGTLKVERYVDGALVATDNLSFPASEFALVSYRFEYRDGHSYTLNLTDTADVSSGADTPGTWVDKIGLVRELARPYVKGFGQMTDPALMPEEGTSPVFVGKDSGFTEMLYWVANGSIYGMPFWALNGNGTAVPTWNYAVGTHPTQPILFKLKDGSLILATTGAGFVYAFRLPVDPTPLTFNVSLAFGNAQTLNALAYLEGWIVLTTLGGSAVGLEISHTSLKLSWKFDAGLGQSHAIGSMFHDKAYFGFDNGLLAISYNLTKPAAEAWRLGLQEWPDPRSHCPPATAQNCTGPPLPNVNRSIVGAPLFDMGNIFVVAYNATETDLYRLSEDGDTIWAVKVETRTQGVGLNWTAPQLVLRYETVVVLGTVMKSYHRTTGDLVVGHDFNYSWTGNFYASPVATDREIIAPGPDGIYFFASPLPQGFGDAFPADMNKTFGAVLEEDVVWRANESALVNRQPIAGDFDGSGYRDLIYANATGFVFLKDFEVGYRSYVEYGQRGRDAAHGANAEYLFSYTPTDPLDPDMDFDNLTDGAEIVGYFGYAQVEAEDATEFHAWADSAANGSAKNFNFFHQTGVTLTSDDGNVSYAADQKVSWIRIPAHIDTTGVYKVSLVPNLAVKEIVDLQYAQGQSITPDTVDTSQGLGVGASLQNRSYVPEATPINLTEGQVERVRQILENATYLKVGYASFYGPGSQTSFGVARNAKVTVYSVAYDPNNHQKVRLVVFVSMDFEFELYGPKDYSFEVGLNLSLVPTTGLGGSALPGEISLLRILDIDKVHIERRGLAPLDPDAENDGVLDGDEASWYPWDGDVDKDGISDRNEVLVYGTNPGDRDTDHDGLRDRVELGLGQTNTDDATIYDTTASWASYPEWLAAKFRGDPHFRPPTVNRVLPNWDADTSTHTDPLNPDSDGDGVPDGWVDGWIYDASGIRNEIRHSGDATQEYMTRAEPVEYDSSNWKQSGDFDNYAQIWEGEDANLDGAKQGNQTSQDPKDHWSFWVSTADPAGGFRDATRLSFIRKGQGESDAANPDTDNDGLPEGYEIFYATREPVLRDPSNLDSYYYTPVTDEGSADDDSAYLDPPINETPQGGSPTSQLIVNGTSDQGKGIQIPDPQVNPTVARLVYTIALNLNGTVNGTSVVFELWQSNNSTTTPQSVLFATQGLALNVSRWVSFDIGAQWLNFSMNHYYAILKDPSSNVTWWNNDTSGNKAWLARNETGVWSSSTLTNKHPSIRVFDAYSIVGDGLNNSEEFVLGTNPKLRDTDAHTAGPLSDLGDLMSDGNETANRTIFRTNAYHGALNSLHYGDGAWILFDPSMVTNSMSDWMYYEWLENATSPNETFGGAKNRTSYLFTLPDGSEFRINVSADRLYLYRPGANFEDLDETKILINVTHNFTGSAIVFYRLNASAAPDAYKTNAVIPVPSNKWLFQGKQFYASDPFDWDTDNDGLADGWEYQVSGFNDTDGDFVPDIRDFDSDGDGLTDGQEMLQVSAGWRGDTTAVAQFDPDGDGKFPMVDTDSDGDGIPDAKEVLWSVDTDGDSWINLVDADSDGEGLCDGWCTNGTVADWRGWKPTAGGLPNGEDSNQNGANEQNESSPIKVDTDTDGLWDGYAKLSGSEVLDSINGTACPLSPTAASHCGEDSSYLLFNGSTAGRTNRTSSDSDKDGVTDFTEVRGWTFDVWLLGMTKEKRWTASDPWKNDTDSDGLPDGVERAASNATASDTDGDGILDGIEDANHDGKANITETGVTIQDTDNDGLPDGNMTIGGKVRGEDLNCDGILQNTETNPLDPDSDNDGMDDALELDLMLSVFPTATPAHDTDGDGWSDLRDRDADNDGLDDGVENRDRNGTVNATTELDPYDSDTDDDGLLDGAEFVWDFDTDNDGKINGRDNDSNGDLHTDNEQVFVVFRTNATSGEYAGAGVWIAVPEIVVNVTASAPDLSAANALFRWDSTVQAPQGTPYQVIYKGIPRYVFTPDGKAIFYLQNGTNDEVFIYVSPGRYEKFKESMNVPSDYTSSAYFTASFLVNHQETYYGWRAVDLNSDVDDDDDGIPNIRETAAGTNPYSNDSDGDGVLDRIEWDWNRDTDLDGKINALDKDSDNDGVPDGTEDANRDGIRQKNETYATRQDSDLDLIQDGTELGFSSGTADTNTTSDSNHPGMWLFTPDAQNWTTTLPLDIDSDDDGIDDGKEDSGNGGSSSYNGRYDNTSETNASTNDTDGDRLADGLELGVQVPTWQTDTTKFVADRSPLNITNPREPDSDFDGLGDSVEDRNLDGTWTLGTDETDAGNWDSDHDGLCDGNCSGKGEDKNLNMIRDEDAHGNWLETDPLANDSDIDGLLDGAEVNGTWCFHEQIEPCSNVALDPLNPDSDADGLREGQEINGWMVNTWREGTLEPLDSYFVVSLPYLNDTDYDGNSDFVEYQNGSDPWRDDTDGDGFNDSFEATHGMNVTGWYNTPPEITNWSLRRFSVEDGLAGVGSGRTVLRVAFDVSAYHGIGAWSVTYGWPVLNASAQQELDQILNSTTWNPLSLDPFGLNEKLQRVNELLARGTIVGPTVSGNGAGNKSVHFELDFNQTWEDVNTRGAWLDVQISDPYSLGVQKREKVKSTLDVVIDLVNGIAKQFSEAASGFLNWIYEGLKWIAEAAMQLINEKIGPLLKPMLDGLRNILDAIFAGGFQLLLEGFTKLARGILGDFYLLVFGTMLGLTIGLILLYVFTAGAAVALKPLIKSVFDIIIGFIIGAIVTAILDFTGVLDMAGNFLLSGIQSILELLIGPTQGLELLTVGVAAAGAAFSIWVFFAGGLQLVLASSNAARWDGLAETESTKLQAAVNSFEPGDTAEQSALREAGLRASVGHNEGRAATEREKAEAIVRWLPYQALAVALSLISLFAGLLSMAKAHAEEKAAAAVAAVLSLITGLLGVFVQHYSDELARDSEIEEFIPPLAYFQRFGHALGVAGVIFAFVVAAIAVYNARDVFLGS